MGMHNKMTESKFRAVKIMLNGGATYDEITNYLQVSSSAICRIKAAETWEEYLQMNAARALAEKEKKRNAAQKPVEMLAEKPVEMPVVETPVEPVVQVVEHRQSVTIQATHYMMEEMKQTNELLKLISSKLAYIVEQLA